MRSWHHSIVTRFALAASCLVAVVVFLAGWLVHRETEKRLLSRTQTLLAHRADLMELRLHARTDEMINDVRAFSETPAVLRLIDGEGFGERAEDEVNALFQALLSGKRSYFQARVILADGSEVVRLDQSEEGISVVSEEDLQDKGDRPYVKDTLTLPPGSIYLSDINLNREHDTISLPEIPTLRASTPLHNREGELYGALVINVDLRPLFRELDQLVDDSTHWYLCNGEGDYLVHPDPGKAFGFDYGRRFRLSDEFPYAEDRLKETSSVVSEGDELVLYRRFTIAPDRNPKELIIALSYSMDELLTGLKEVRNQSLFTSGLVAALLVLVVVFLFQLFARRLRHVIDAIDRLDPGVAPSLAIDNSRDEVGILSRKFSDMASKIREQIQTLQEARQRAEEATKVKEEFLATMSHEIRTPLNAVVGMTHLLESNRPAPHQIGMIRTLKFSSQTLMALLNEVLDYSKIRSGTLQLDAGRTDIRQLFENVYLSHKPDAQRKGLRFDYLLDEDLPRWVEADEIRLFQIFNNLVSNALKFTDKGFVRMELRMPRLEGGLVELEFVVIDSGVGVKEENLERIFLPFGQERHRYRGTGLGLSITRALVELHGGTLECQSRSGEGSRFEVHLSLPLSVQTAEVLGQEDKGSDLEGKRILLVEDVAFNRELVVAYLERTRVSIEHAGSCQAALNAFGSLGPFDAYLLDLHLPDGSGIELGESIRARSPGALLIAVTARVTPEARQECLEKGFAAFLPKPLDPDRLISCLSALLAESLSAPDFTHLLDVSDGQPERYLRLLQLLYADFESSMDRIQKALEMRNPEAFREVAHKLKNATSELKLTRLDSVLQALAESLEMDAPFGDLAQTCREIMQQTLRAIDEEISRVKAVAEEVIL